MITLEHCKIMFVSIRVAVQFDTWGTHGSPYKTTISELGLSTFTGSISRPINNSNPSVLLSNLSFIEQYALY